MPIYAKIRNKEFIVLDNDFTSKGFIIEIRKIEDGALIKTDYVKKIFQTKDEAVDYIIENGWHLTRTWGDAERKELVYRDDNRGWYRTRPSKKASGAPNYKEMSKDEWEKYTEAVADARWLYSSKHNTTVTDENVHEFPDYADFEFQYLARKGIIMLAKKPQ